MKSIDVANKISNRHACQCNYFPSNNIKKNIQLHQKKNISIIHPTTGTNKIIIRMYPTKRDNSYKTKQNKTQKNIRLFPTGTNYP